MGLRAWALAIVAGALCVACTRHSSSAVAVPSSGAERPATLAQPSVGASILASIDNARRAITLGDPIAADNDISQALDASRNAINQFLPVSMSGGGGSSDSASDAQALSAILGSFSTRVKLVSAQTLLTNGDIADADATLMALQRLVPARLVPGNLPLVEAAASLERARQAAALGTPELRTQLACAQAALHAYRGPADLAETTALAAALDRALADPAQIRTLLPHHVDLWLGSVAQCAGTAR